MTKWKGHRVFINSPLEKLLEGGGGKWEWNHVLAELLELFYHLWKLLSAVQWRVSINTKAITHNNCSWLHWLYFDKEDFSNNGDNIIIKCEHDNGNEVFWKTDNANNRVNKEGDTLTITDAKYTDTGVYMCR